MIVEGFYVFPVTVQYIRDSSGSIISVRFRLSVGTELHSHRAVGIVGLGFEGCPLRQDGEIIDRGGNVYPEGTNVLQSAGVQQVAGWNAGVVWLYLHRVLAVAAYEGACQFRCFTQRIDAPTGIAAGIDLDFVPVIPI